MSPVSLDQSIGPYASAGSVGGPEYAQSVYGSLPHSANTTGNVIAMTPQAGCQAGGRRRKRKGGKHSTKKSTKKGGRRHGRKTRKH